MCGIIGYIGKQNAVPILIDGLKRLEYRGYDSAGLAVVDHGRMAILRAVGKLANLERLVGSQRLESFIGLGHVRWATHGKPSEENAHPHRVGRVALVHNGIIENYLDLKQELIAQGRTFVSETDTEVIGHLVDQYRGEGHGLVEAVRLALGRVQGAYALGVVAEDEPETLVAARNGSPLVVGLGDGEFFIASDIPAILSYTRDVVFLDDREIAVLTPGGVEVTDLEGRATHEKPVSHILWNPVMAEKGGYKHFMLKEIHEQPRAITDTLRGRLSLETGTVFLDEINLSTEAAQAMTRIHLVACGTSWHAALVGKFLLEDLTRLPAEVDIASEFRYRDPILDAQSLLVAITQSGETADTLAAMREAKGRGAQTLAICNVVGSTASREADGVLYSHAGPEIGVASTKAFTTQLVALFLLALHLGRLRGTVNEDQAKALLAELVRVPQRVERALEAEEAVSEVARLFHERRDFLYLARGINYPVALEGALKLKEISYIHAEGYPAGEMKHGPIALIDEHLPVVVLAPRDALYEKVRANIEEVKARGGTVIGVTTEGNEDLAGEVNHCLVVPGTVPSLQPILLSIPMQLLAYHIADLRGSDVDQPRNLAKSVTVE